MVNGGEVLIVRAVIHTFEVDNLAMRTLKMSIVFNGPHMILTECLQGSLQVFIEDLL